MMFSLILNVVSVMKSLSGLGFLMNFVYFLDRYVGVFMYAITDQIQKLERIGDVIFYLF